MLVQPKTWSCSRCKRWPPARKGGWQLDADGACGRQPTGARLV